MSLPSFPSGSELPAAQVAAATARREAFLLHLLQCLPGGCGSLALLTRKLRTRTAQDVGLTAASLSEMIPSLVAAGLIARHKRPRSEQFVLTPAGADRLDRARNLLPPPRGFKPPSNERVAGLRRQFLLLQALAAPQLEISEKAGNAQLSSFARGILELNAVTATHLRHELAEDGLFTTTGIGRARRYRLTPAGRLEAANQPFPPDRHFRLSGALLNELLEAAREVGKQFQSESKDAAAGLLPTEAELEAAIVKSFESLRAERYSATGLVPVCEIREDIQQRFGDAAARHLVFDGAVLRLWRSRRLRLTPISDMSRATPEQIQNAIPGVGETLYYVEPFRDAALV